MNSFQIALICWSIVYSLTHESFRAFYLALRLCLRFLRGNVHRVRRPGVSFRSEVKPPSRGRGTRFCPPFDNQTPAW